MEAWQNFHHMNICTFVPKNIKSFIFLASNIAPILECWIHRGECKPAQSSERFGWVLIYQYFVHQNWHLFSYLLLPMNVFVFFLIFILWLTIVFISWSYIEADICEPILVSNSDMEPIVEHQLGNVLLNMKPKQGYLEAWVHSDTLHKLCDLYFGYVSCGSCIQFYWYYNSNPKLLIYHFVTGPSEKAASCHKELLLEFKH